jgi:hypothetical protein
VLAGALAALVAGALAYSNPMAGSQFTGESGHHRYGVALYPKCFSTGCKKATTVDVQVTVGSPKTPNGKCVYGTWQLANAKLKHHKFKSTGEIGGHGNLYVVKVTGVFTSSVKVHGTIYGPNICGGKSSYRLQAKTAG